MRLTEILFLAMLPGTGLAACGKPYAGKEVNGTLLKSIVLDMGTDAANVAASQYDEFFEQGSALEGTKAVIAAGNFHVNLWAMPGTEEDFQSDDECSESGYLVNQVSWLYYNSTSASYYSGFAAETEADSYDDAALSVATSIVAGLEVRLWDTNGDGYTDLIDADYLEGVTVDTITENANGTVSVYRGNIDVSAKTSNEGSTFDNTRFNGTGPLIPSANFDTSIAEGEVALFWYGSNGWAMKRPQRVTGIFVDGADHTSYQINDTVYLDAMRFSRDNIFISNRPGEITDAQKFFKLTNDSTAGLDVNLWLVPVTNTTNVGGPISITSGSSARTFLTKAVAYAQAQLDGTTISTNGSDVPSTQEWVTQDVYTQLDDAVARANSTLSSADSSAFLSDYQTYVLYLTLSGSSDDIGAVFAGFDYTGFENQTQYGTA